MKTNTNTPPTLTTPTPNQTKNTHKPTSANQHLASNMKPNTDPPIFKSVQP